MTPEVSHIQATNWPLNYLKNKDDTLYVDTILRLYVCICSLFIHIFCCISSSIKIKNKIYRAYAVCSTRACALLFVHKLVDPQGGDTGPDCFLGCC